MVKHMIRIGLVSLLAIAMLLGATTVVADGGDNADAVIDISIKGDPKVEIVARGPCEVNVKREASSEANTIGMFLSPDPVTYSEGGAVIDISINGDSEVDIVARGACEVNLRVEGPSQVYIDAGDEVELNVEAGDESQVFIDEQSLDNPAPSPVEPSATPETQDADEDSSGSGSRVPIISGAVLVLAGLPCFFLIRRKTKK